MKTANTIKNLLKASGYPSAWVQGHHTRIVMNEDEIFIVYQRINKDSPSSVYSIELYRGQEENIACEYFIDSENSQ